MDASFEFPTANPSDASDVATALETATALWRRGDSREALRWLRRAAEGAESEGDDLRAVALARAAAELQDRLPQPSSMPAPSASRPPPQVTSTPLPAPSRPPPVSRQPPPFTQAATPSQVRASAAPPPPSQRSLANTGGLEPWMPPGSRPPPAAERSSPRSSGPPPLPTSELASSPVSAKPPPPPAAPVAPAELAPQTPTPEPPRAAAESPSAAAREPAPAGREEGTVSPGAPRARTALRVSVEVLSKKSGTLLVRLLGEDASPPANAHEALLVPLDPEVDLRNL